VYTYLMEYEALTLLNNNPNMSPPVSVFNDADKRELKVRLEELPKQIKNPFMVLRQWIKWEIWEI